ncbi:hypothetical protein [Bosea sp. OK403]|uniref:hypothetical protein n=1 Tax=Bosea sp. OK403 TaxID=1855286 RepID=UPI001113AC63|nr:hypothetical protein [Bosea sp. OK403]
MKKPTVQFPGQEALGTVKFGPGVVGRTAPVAVGIVILGIAAVAALRSEPWMAFLAFGASLSGAIWYLSSILQYANKYPNHAIMEGAEFVKNAALEQSAKDPNIIDLNSIPVDNTSAPENLKLRGQNYE